MGNKRKNRAPKRGEKSGSNRSWKSLSQDVGETPVTTIAWRKRLAPLVKLAAFAGFVVASGFGVKFLASKIGDMERTVLTGMGENPIIREVYFETDGVLTETLVKEHLDLYEGSLLMDYDIFELKADLESFDQIRTASVERSISDAFIKIRLVERDPVFKMVVQGESGNELLLVDREGHSFKGHGFSRNTLHRLPALGGVALKIEGGQYLPLEEIVELNYLQKTILQMVPQWFTEIDSITLQPKSTVSTLLGHQFVISTPWCDALIFDENAVEDQLIRLDRLMEGLVSSGVDLEKRTLDVVDMTVDDRAIVRFDRNRGPRAALKTSRTRIL